MDIKTVEERFNDNMRRTQAFLERAQEHADEVKRELLEVQKTLRGANETERAYTEDKQEILDLLLPALQWTNACEDLCSLEYDEESEIVTATFAHGSRKINVAMDSGISMIRDVLKQIV